MLSKTPTSFALPAAALLFAACASVPQERGEQQALVSQANSTLQMMTAKDPSLQPVLDQSAGYVVFPRVGEVGALAVGGTQGIGVVFERGQPVGFSRIREATFGPQLGGQSFSQLIILQNRDAMNRLRAGNFDLTADAQATALGWGAGARTQFEEGVAVIVSSEQGLIAGATIGGQEITFEPMA
jgi:lipid-binding SYLF domain-containing protein